MPYATGPLPKFRKEEFGLTPISRSKRGTICSQDEIISSGSKYSAAAIVKALYLRDSTYVFNSVFFVRIFLKFSLAFDRFDLEAPMEMPNCSPISSCVSPSITNKLNTVL